MLIKITKNLINLNLLLFFISILFIIKLLINLKFKLNLRIYVINSRKIIMKLIWKFR